MSELHAEMMVTPTLRLKRPLGAGGMASVWVADHLTLKTEVVVKFMSKELAANVKALGRFSREAAAAARVKSPHVVQTFDSGVTSAGLPYIVMELLDGMDLAAHLEQRGKLPPSEVAALCMQIAKALGKAHAAGIVHRDIKPANIFLCDGEVGEVFVKVLDFGIAKADERLGSGTTTGQIVGTPFYMSPEQIVGRTIDLRTDIWSMGIVAFEMLTGRVPFDDESIGALTLAIHSPEGPRPSSVDPSVPPAFDAWFARACALEPDARFASARDAGRALVEALGGEVPAAPMGIATPRRSVVGVHAATLLESAQAIDSQDARRPRRIPPVILGAVGVAAVIGLGSLALRSPRGGGTVAPPPEPADAAAAGSPVTLAPPVALAPPARAGSPVTLEHAALRAPASASAPVAAVRPGSRGAASLRAIAPNAASAPSVGDAATQMPMPPAQPSAFVPSRPVPPRGSDDDIR